MTQDKSLFNSMNTALEHKHSLYILVILILSAVFSFLLFDAKVNMMGDDAEYIHYGYKFAKNFDFPRYRGPLYPILLSPFIAVLGINVPMLKILSAIMVLSSMLFLYKAFYRKVPTLILFSTLFLLSINSYLLSYSSATLSEPLFLLIQSLLLYCFCRYFIEPQENISIAKLVSRFFVIGLLILCLTLTRTVGYAAIGVVAIYFLLMKQWKNALISTAVSGVVFGLFGLVKKILWSESGSAYELSTFFTIDMYNSDRGNEDFSGIVTRLFENTNNYISKFTMQFLGLKTDVITSSMLVTTVIMLLLCWGGYVAFKKNKTLFFAALYTVTFCGANFIILHAVWQQERFIIVYYPLILFILFTGFYYFFESRKGLQFVYILLFAVVAFSTLSHTGKRVQANSKNLSMSLRGNTLYGIAPDWQNYVQMSRWVAQNIPESDMVAARKPGTSTIYSGRERDFHGIYSVPSVPKDSLNSWNAAPEKTILIADLSKENLVFIADYLTFVAQGNIILNGEVKSIAAIYEINNSELENYLPLLNQKNITYTTNYAQFRSDFLKFPDNLMYSPESMLESLKSRNVRYMHLASIRVNAGVNDGNIISTLHRYANIMSIKYPNLIQEKIVIGQTEPSILIELKY